MSVRRSATNGIGNLYVMQKKNKYERDNIIISVFGEYPKNFYFGWPSFNRRFIPKRKSNIIKVSRLCINKSGPIPNVLQLNLLSQW